MSKAIRLRLPFLGAAGTLPPSLARRSDLNLSMPPWITTRAFTQALKAAARTRQQADAH